MSLPDTDAPTDPPREPGPRPRTRHALSTPNLAFHFDGDRAVAAKLQEALGVPPMPTKFAPEDRPILETTLATHLFHSFAARMHPLLVRQLLADVQPGQVVLDPFVGSGTVLVEALMRGARGVGCDVNELSVRLARFKATPLPPAMQRALVQKAQAVAAASTERVEKRKRPRRTWDDASFYPPHVYLELCGLREELDAVSKTDAPLGEALLLVLSSILLKVSHQRAESRPDQIPRHIGKTQATRWFAAKAEELGRLHAALWAKLPSPTPPAPLVIQGDARTSLSPETAPRDAALPLWPGSVDRVVTSPPYLGTYDYVDHHERRYAWLGIDPDPVRRGEMASRRHGQSTPLPELLAQHQRDSDAWVGAVGRLLRPDGLLDVVVGDSVVSGQPLRGDVPIRKAAERAGLRFVAACGAERPQFIAKTEGLPPRLEHLLRFARPR